MTRTGCVLLLLFAAVIGGFAWIVERGKRSPVPATSQVIDVDGPVVPVSGVQRAQLHDSWGEPRAGGVRAHHALDIMAPRGAPVIAAASGRVEKLFESRDGGHTIYIRREDTRWIDYYAHLDTYAPDLREGVVIRMGQQIGTVGSSGDADASASHLHYEIKRMAPGEKWWQGTDVNPYPLLTATR